MMETLPISKLEKKFYKSSKTILFHFLFLLQDHRNYSSLDHLQWEL